MATIRYNKTFFQSPGRISEDVYYSIKQELSKNPDFIIAQGETFSEHFKGYLRWITIGLIGFFVFILLADSVSRSAGDKLGFLSGICFLVALVNGIQLMLEGPSFATYVKKRDEYFSRMRYAIINSNTYNEFIKMFY